MTDPTKITLRPVDITNYYAVMKLAMQPGQERFIDSNAWPRSPKPPMCRGFTPEAIYRRGDLVGLISWRAYHPDYGYQDPPEHGAYVIDHIMIAAPFQGEGLGRRVAQMLIARFRAMPECRSLVIMHHKDNDDDAHLYPRLGFTVSGETHEHDLILRLDVASP